MSPSQRELIRIELNRSMRCDPAEVPALRLLDATPLVGPYEPQEPDACTCGIPLEPGDYLHCERCARERGDR